MCLKPTLLASAIALGVVTMSRAQAEVVYTVFNSANNFTLFVYDSPDFITTDTMVGVAQLAFANPLNSITSVDFIPDSSTFPGTSELDVLQSAAPEQFRYYPQGTFTQVGVTPGDSNSFGYPNSMLSVETPEPGTVGLLGVGLVGLFGLRRRARGAKLSGS
jgi:PEP-CTERM motif-containing protein